MIRPQPLSILILAISFCSLFVSSWQPPLPQQPPSSRREWLTSILTNSGRAATLLVATTTTTVALLASSSSSALAAPPIAIIAQELGYFPVTNSRGETMYVPKRVSRESSDQAMALARHLQSTNAKVYETYWCPHSARQRELFGRQAWELLNHVECSPKGYHAQPSLCVATEQVDGYPTWIFQDKTVLGGERPLKELAIASGFPGTFDESLELNLPPALGSSSCR